MRFERFLPILAFALLSGACGTPARPVGAVIDAADTMAMDVDTSDATDAGPPELPLEQLRAALTDVYCAASLHCKPTTGLTFATMEGCRTAIGSNLDWRDLAALVDGVKAGKIQYDAQQAVICVAALKSSDCQLLETMARPTSFVEPLDTRLIAALELQADCTTTFAGTVEDADSCTRREECKSRRCVKLDTRCSVGTCQARVGVGGSCTQDDECDSEVCDLGKCVPDTAQVGQPCDIPYGPYCVAGAYCGVVDGSLQCAAQLAEGEDCSGDSWCKSGFCQRPENVMSGSCAARGKVGTACKVAFDTPESNCGEGLVCVGTQGEPGSCVPRVTIGGACQYGVECGGWDVGCLGDTTKTCQPLPAKGQPCKPTVPTKGDGQACQVPNVCTGGTCVDTPGPGQPCALTAYDPCVGELWCDISTGTCQPLPGLGQPCALGGICAPDLRCDLEKKTCAPLACK